MASSVRRCAFCDTRLPADASPRRKFCDEDCRRGRPKKPNVVELGPLGQATEEAIAAATAAGSLSARQAGAVQAMRILAMKVDTEAELRLAAVIALREGIITKPPPIDNVTLPTYLNYCTALGLIVSPKESTGEKKPEGSGGNKVLQLAQGVRKPKGA